MSDLLLMASSPLRYLQSIPGTVALYLPWRDVYGRNVATPRWSNISGLTTSDDYEFYETTDDSSHSVRMFYITNMPMADMDMWMSVTFTPIGRKRFLLDPVMCKVIVDVDTMSVISYDSIRTSSDDIFLKDNSDGSYTLTVKELIKYYDSGINKWFSLMPDNATEAGDRTYVGDVTKGMIIHKYQCNYGFLYPYSEPSGLSQILLDYSGNGNHAMLGTTAGVDTNDPAWGSVLNHFDGIDDVYSNWPDAEYELHAWGSAINSFGWVSAVPTETPGHYFGGILLNRTPGAGEEARIKGAMRALLASRGVALA